MGSLRLTLFGGFQAQTNSGAAIALSSRKAQALLAYLALRPGEALRRRQAWFEAQHDLEPERLVFSDETGASTRMARRHGP